MPEYLYPGVYVEEVNTGNKPIEGVSTSTVGFLGISERGPTTPRFISSFSEFVRNYGSYFQEANGADRYLAFGVEGCFLNGGKRCYVQRVTRSTARPAPAAGAPAPAGGAAAPNAATVAFVTIPGFATITAVGPGDWGNRVQIPRKNATPNNSNLFAMTSQNGAPGV